ncbi:MAG TPA: TetR/AcrR family transcriptional regulator [Nocardioides sp.]|nr:TetR/AcrR family transcriptional regulator [Nocardioides sp.]
MKDSPTTVRRRGGPTKGDQREHAILEATRTLLAGRNVNELTIDAIAKAAGVSRTAFYFYFPTKQAVVAALLDGLWEQFGSTHGWFDSEGADRAGLLEHHHLVARVWHEHLPILTCTTGAVEYEPLIEWVERARTRLVTGLATKIQRDQDAGIAPTGVGATALAEMIADLRESRMRAIAELRGAAYDAGVADLTEVVLRIIYGTA